MTTSYYYDPDGQLIATSAPGGLWTKDVYNGADEVVEEYQTDGGSGTTYSDAGTVSGDVVLTQTEYVYNGDGEVTETMTSQRYNTDSTTATGALGSPSSGNNALIYYEGYYYDAAGREIAAVNVGDNGNTAWDMSDSPPSRSADALLRMRRGMRPLPLTVPLSPPLLPSHSTARQARCWRLRPGGGRRG